MEAKAHLKFTRISPRKARLVVGMISGKKIDVARDQLSVSVKKSAPIVLKVLNSAIQNAEHNKKLKADDLIVSKAFVDEGATLKRWRPRAFGKAAPIRKRTSRITVVVSDGQDNKGNKENKDKKS
ncbi:50S ribosomal protein L22 [Patescibacteria group bacterium]|nr:50S ribosomal protein L22 [Patescibacteria group bacterium]